jgi:type IV pilus assembly protein PilY1
MKIKKALAAIQILCLVFLNGWNVRLARADDSDIFGTNIQPNVMILFDQSGSMADTIFSNPYNSTTTYNTPLTYNTANVFQQFTSKNSCKPDPKPCYKFYAATVSAVSNSSAQTALNATGYWTGKISGSNVSLFTGNYLNWLACSTCSASDTKIHIAQQVISNLLGSVTGVRFGIMEFQNSNSPEGGTMVAPMGTDTTTMINAVNAITANGNTPTGEALRDVGKYFSGTFGSYSSPIQYSCQPNFVIIISDGMWNGTIDPATQATTEYTTDHSSSFAGTQNLIIDTIGFNLPAGDSGIASLQSIAQNAGGTYYSANNYAQLETALHNAIQQIIAATFSFATPVIPTTATSGSTRAYLASFQSSPASVFWRGFLKAYNRDSSGLIPVDSNGIPTGTPAWDAGQLLSQKAASSRTIYTAVSGTRQNFVKTNSAITNTLLAASSNAEHDAIIDFIRGIDTYDENANGNTTEERAWKLGDIFHSTPVVVSPPFLPSNDAMYNSFKTANASRTTILLAGANDGMLHAFRESDGQELWGFIPTDLLDNLKELTATSGSHEFFVDSSPVAADIKIGSSWKTIAIFGERRGGKYYYALDITDTTNPQYLWSFTDSKMGESWSEPVVGKVKMADGTDKFVAFIGGGYDTSQNNNSGKAFFVIDLSSGAKLWEYYHSTGASDDSQYVNFSLAANPTAADLDNDGYIDRVYIADVGGQLWKFNTAPTGGATVSGGLVSNWAGKRLFAANISQANPPASGEYYPAQAIYVPPVLSYDSTGNLWVYFGTGDRNHPNNTSTNRFYGIKENTAMTNGSTLTESSLTNVTSGSGTVTQGWYVVLANNEKVLSASDVFNNAVFFTSFTPVTAAACGTGGGDAKLYAVNLDTGDAAINLTSGAVVSPGQAAYTAAKAIGTGIPSRPIVIINQSGNVGNPFVITGTTNQQISSTPVPQVAIRRLVAWREVF